MKVIGLFSQNIMGIKVAEVRPGDDPMVLISGDNGAGKSSLLDSISYAIGGKKLIPKNPIRKGEDEAKILVELDKFNVTRTFKRKKDADGYDTMLKVTAKDGGIYSKGQQILDELLGELTLDPYEFAGLSAKKQAEILMRMVELGIDLDAWGRTELEIIEYRAGAKREFARLVTTVGGMQSYDDVSEGAKERDISQLTEELQAANDSILLVSELNADLEAQSHMLKVKNQGIVDTKEKIDKLEGELVEKRRYLDTIKETIPGVEKSIAILETRIADIGEIDTAPIQDNLNTAEEFNKKVRGKAAYSIQSQAKSDAAINLQAYESKLKAHRSAKDQAIKKAHYPVDGLMFSGEGLLYNGIPLEQASTGEKIHISTLIGMELNPKLKILLIRFGSLLGKKNFNIIRDLAIEYDYQIWCEVVDDTGEIGFYMEEGEIKINPQGRNVISDINAGMKSIRDQSNAPIDSSIDLEENPDAPTEQV